VEKGSTLAADKRLSVSLYELFYFGQNRKRNMKKTFQKSLIAAAALSAMSAGFAAERATTNIIFPYISTGANAVTLITLTTPVASPAAITYRYAMKAIGAANTVGCDHQDGTSTLTANDVVQFEVSNKFVFNTAFANGDTNTGYTYSGGAGKQGFLIVNNNANVGGLLYGEAIVIDSASGLRLAYSSQSLSTDNAAIPDFGADNLGATGGPMTVSATNVPGGAAAVTHGANIVTWMNAGTTAAPIVNTGWYVVPLGTAAEMTPSGVIGGLIASYSMTDTTVGVGGQYGAYNMTEAFTSGAVKTPVRCTGYITRANMLQDGALADTAKGGMAQLVSFNGAIAAESEDLAGGAASVGGVIRNKSLVYKVQGAGSGASALGFISREASR